MKSSYRHGNVILDIEGTSITAEDREVLQHPAVAGVILFSRNYENKEQIKKLITEIKKIRPLLIAVDQEGGRVQRFTGDFINMPAMNTWGESYQKQPDLAKKHLKQAITALAIELKQVGIDIDLIPVLDLNQGVSEIIGERSLNKDPEIVIELGRIIISALQNQGMSAVGKHFPGHGGVSVDSHEQLPVDQRDFKIIQEVDAKPFIELANQLDAIMPAHIVFSEIDQLPATFSHKILTHWLRDEIGFQGVIISDDLTMRATAAFGAYAERALMALQAGCDLLLVCNNRQGAIEAVEAIEKMGSFRLKESRQRIEKYIRNPL